ncbi:hypothetical protein MVEN_00577400 [Mycena venus]|uniref:Uncharacterized protein n=1 Tax=Mycena venus TaxID=2733690 RepID=A0A8H7D831_9AGAR|nr:hypothetical protein MVEN_00577400 [Mycena venus]
MSLFVGYAKNYAKSLLGGSGVPGRVKNITVALYHRPPSGLALFAPVLIAVDAIVIVNTVAVTWRNWKTEAKAEGEVAELRPLWMRIGVCSMEIATGALVAASLLIYRSRTATMLSILPPKKANVAPTALNRRIFLQSAGSWRANGTIYPLSACTLTRVAEKVLLLEINGQYGGWQFNLDNHTVIEGHRMASAESACKTLATQWHGAGGKGTILTA